MVLHVGARTHRYADGPAAAVATHVAVRAGLPLVVVGSRSADVDLRTVAPAALDLREALTFPEECAVVVRSSGGIGPDSAIAHVAGCADVKFVAVVDPAVAWLSETGISPSWWLAHYQGVTFMQVSEIEGMLASEAPGR